MSRQAIGFSLLGTVIISVVVALAFVVPILEAQGDEWWAKHYDWKYRLALDEFQAKRDTGLSGTKYIVPLLDGKRVAIAGETVPVCELHRRFDWAQKPDATFVVYRKVPGSQYGNVFFTRVIIMERPYKRLS